MSVQEEGGRLRALSDCEADALQQRLMGFKIDVYGAALPFSARLCRENCWHETYAERCITEYKRFLYLVLRSERELTPSDQVDQVWHLHLLYTQSYWIDLCQQTLGCPLHHLPTKGGGRELARFKVQYQATLDSYRACFGAEPPADIWPSVEDRFRHADAFVRANRASHWLIRKPPAWLTASMTGSLFLLACTQQDGERGGWFYIMLCLGGYGVVRFLIWLVEKSGKGKGGSGCGGGTGCGGCGGCGG
jgi:hypothetical protein